MNAASGSEAGRTTTERKSDTELVVTRTFNAPRHLVYRAWSEAELFRQWWVPKSVPMTLDACEMDVRTGGTYKLVFSHPDFPQPMAFFGRYLEVVAPSKIQWTNEESGDAGQVTTVTFEEKGGKTLVVMHDLYPSKEALDEAVGSGSTGAADETFEQLEALLAEGASR